MITAQELVAREVKYCVSRLVSALAEGIHAPEGLNVEGTVLGELARQALYLAAPTDDWEEPLIEAGWSKVVEGDGYAWRHPEDIGDHGEPNAQIACEEARLDPYQREVHEHWLVSDWFAHRLEAHGEKVDRDFAGLTVWARTTTGQALYADAVVEAIAAEMNKAESP
jgi:hypothetical protein